MVTALTRNYLTGPRSSAYPRGLLMDGLTEPLLFHPQGGPVRRARDAAHLTSLGMHLRRH